MRYCIEFSNLFCRSFYYANNSDNCYIGVDSFYQPTNNFFLVSAIPSDNFHLYEPVCLDESIELPCPSMHIFERIIETNLVSKFDDEKQLFGQGLFFLFHIYIKAIIGKKNLLLKLKKRTFNLESTILN